MTPSEAVAEIRPPAAPERPVEHLLRGTALDALLTLAIVGLSLNALVGFHFGAPAAAPRAYLYQTHHPRLELDLRQNKVFSLGATQIEVKDGAVRILKSDCPHGLCRHVGWIRKPGATIACVPNKIFIEIAAGDDEAPTAYDTVTY